MATPAIDFSKYEAQAPAPAGGAAPQIDFSKYTAPAAQSGPSDDWLKSHYAKYGDTSIDQARDRYSKRDFWDKAEDVIQAPADYFVNHTSNAIDAAKSGQYAKAANEGIKAGSLIAAPLLPESIAAAPLTAARVVAGGYLANKAGQAVASGAGATPDQAELAGNVTGLIGGAGAGTGAIRAFLETPAKAALGKMASAADGVVSDDVLGMISPRALHGLKMLRAAAKVAGSSEDSAGLSELAAKHTDAISATEQTLNDALSKANALPPEGPTAKAIDVPDLRVQPAQPAPQNLLEARKAAFQRAQAQAQGGTFQVTPPESATPAAASSTPNGALYNEPIPEQSAQDIYRAKFLQQSQPKPSLIDQLKQWDQIRQIHSQLEDQIGKGQDEIQSWMDDHNQAAPGAKPTGAAATAKARFDAALAAAESKANAIPSDETAVTSKAAAAKDTDFYAQAKAEWQSANPGKDPSSAISQIAQRAQQLKTQPRVPTSDEDMESLLMKSIQNAQAKRSAKTGD